MIFKTWLSDINKVALAVDNLNEARIAGTVSKLNPESLNAFVKGIDGLTLSQAQAALSTRKLTDEQKKQILVSAGLLKTTESITLAEVKEMASSMSLSAQKKEEILTTLQGAYSENEWNKERLEAIVLEGGEASAIAKVILAKKKENAENLKGIASGKSLLSVLKQQAKLLISNPLMLLATTSIAAATGLALAMLKISKTIEEVRDSAKELGDTFSNNKSDIEDYKKQIDDLYKTINNSNSSVAEVTTARQTLMSVQDELIDKFGEEKNTIDLVTQAINGQSSALDTLTQKKWQETKNKFNEGSFWNNIANWSQGYESNIDRMVDEMENPVVRIGMSIKDYESGQYTEIIQQMEKLGWTYSSTLSAFTKSDGLENIYEEILSIQDLVDENAPANFIKELTTEANKAKTTLDNYGSMWDNYILNDKIFANDDLANSWKEVNDAYAKYQDSIASGENPEEAISGFAASINKVLDDDNVSDSVKDYFKDMYPSLYREVEKWEFKTTVIPEFDTTGIKGKTQADILEMLQTDGVQNGEDVFNSIVESAIEYGLIIDDDAEGIQKLLDLLVEWGILQGTILDKTNDIIDETSVATITSSIQQIATQLEPQFAKLGEAYKSIFTSDGFTLDNVDNSMLEDLRTTFAEIEESIGVTFDSEQLEPFFDSLTNGTATADQVQQSFNDLATAYFYSTNTLDNLNESTAESIQKQLEELGVINAKEVVYDTLNAKTEALALQEQFLADEKEELVNAANDKATSFLEQAGASEAARKYLFMLVAAEKVFGSTELSVDEKIKELQKLATAYGQTAIAAKIARRETLLSIDPTDPSISSDEDFLNELEAEINNGISQIEIDFTGIDHNAGKAGKDAAEEYKEALEKELSDLDTVLNFITSTIQDQIDLWGDQKDAAVSALEAERDAAIEALEAQKEALQAQIDAKQKVIDKIKESREERQAEIDLQKAQYNLERLQNQKTRLVKYMPDTIVI